MVRYNADGTLDTSFGVNGIVLGPRVRGSSSFALDASGKIVLFDINETATATIVQRYNSDGSPDTTFGQDGSVTISSTTIDANSHFGVEIQEDGRIVLGAISLEANGDRDAVLIRLLGDPPPPAPPGITITPTSSLQTTEYGGVATFTVVLEAIPVGIVTITLSSSDLTEGTLVGATNDELILTFDASNWDQARVVTIQGEDDDIKDGDVYYDITFTVTSADDSDYDGLLVDSLSLINKDNEKGGRPKK